MKRSRIAGRQELVGREEMVGISRPLPADSGRLVDVPAGPTKGKVLATEVATVPASGSVTMRFTAQEFFLPQRLVFNSANAANIVVDDIKVGTNSQFVSSGSVPAEIFAANAFDVDIEFDTAKPGVNIDVTLSNLTAGDLDIYGAFLGLAKQ